jgi:CRP-like cAMP-binding protein
MAAVFQNPHENGPSGMAEALAFDHDHLEALRLEMPLLLLNFIREQSAKILQVRDDLSAVFSNGSTL